MVEEFFKNNIAVKAILNRLALILMACRSSTLSVVKFVHSMLIYGLFYHYCSLEWRKMYKLIGIDSNFKVLSVGPLWEAI